MKKRHTGQQPHETNAAYDPPGIIDIGTKKRGLFGNSCGIHFFDE
jgi:hypothetical protein